MSRTRLNVLDQMPVPSGGGLGEAMAAAVDLAREAEALGFSRYWVAEHHGAASLASTVPALVIERAASATRRIRVGAGGVMLRNTSAMRTAEVFHALAACHPGRIDLGFGSAPGGDPRATAALAAPRAPVGKDGYAAQAVDLVAYMRGTAEVAACPGVLDHPLPELWLLGSSLASAELAGRLGVSYAFAAFLAPRADAIGAAIGRYRATWDARHPARPRAGVACEVIAAPTATAAALLARSRYLDPAAELLGLRGLLAPGAVAGVDLEPQLAASLEQLAQRCWTGTAEHLRDRLLGLAEASGADEIFLLTNCHALAARVTSYRLLAAAFAGAAQTAERAS